MVCCGVGGGVVGCFRHAGGCVCFQGFWGVLVGVGLRFGLGSCKLFILLPVGELRDWVPV